MFSATPEQMAQAIQVLANGGVLAYPTEAVYGFGCDPFDEQAVHRILRIKNRSVDKGLILIAADWQQIAHLVKPMDSLALGRIFASWPGPVTWVFPASDQAPAWICGTHSTIALRVTAHPVAAALCRAYAGPIVSTSANREACEPVRERQDLIAQFSDEVDYIVPGTVGSRVNPSEIRDACSGRVIRQGSS